MAARAHRAGRWLGVWLTAACCLWATAAQAGTSYYVSPSGSDTASGTSLATPFRTLHKAVNTVQPGDVIELRAGTYNENLIISRPGSASAWITLRGYNGERPVLRGTGAGPTIYFYHDRCDESVIGTGSGNTDCQPMHWVVQGLDLAGSAGGGGDGNVVKIDTPRVRLVGNRLCCSVADVVKLVRTANDVELLDNEIWQDRNITVPSANAQAIDIVGADRTRVAGNHVHDVPDFGIYAKGNARDTLIENNRLVNIGGNALMLGQSTDAHRLADGPYESYNGLVRNNLVINSTWACLAASSSQNARFYNNSCFNTGTVTHGSILLSNESEIGTPSQGIELVNNIIQGSANRPVLRITSNAMADYRTLRIDRNLYFIGGADPRFQADALFGTVGSVAWRAAYTQLSGRSDTSLVANPLFATTTGSSALALQAASPAIDAGLNEPALVPRDRTGVTRPQGAGTDIGAYERLASGSVQALTLSLAGGGSVAITSGGGTVHCSANCVTAHASGSVVALVATPAAGQAFAGWGGACTGTASCSLTMDAARTVTASFTPVAVPTPQLLTLTLSGSGYVSISTGSGRAFICTSSCSRSYPSGAVLTLQATARNGARFSGWTGACSGSAACTLRLSAPTTVGASFAAPDVTAPTVIGTLPAAGATGVAVGTPITASFSEPVNCATVGPASFVVAGVTGTVSCQGSTASFTPSAALAAGTGYTAQITTAVKDLAGNALAASRVWSFTTAEAASGQQFSFLAYGDSRAGNSCDGNAVHASLVNRMVDEPAAMVFNLGDMVVGYDKTTNWVERGDCPADANKGSLKELIAPLQNKPPAPGLPTFYFPVVGNHDDNWGSGWYPDKFGHGFCDVFNPAQLVPNHTQQSYFLDKTTRVEHFTDAQFQSLACSKTDSRVYSRYMYYSFDHKNVHFVVMRVNSDYHFLEECYNSCADPANYDRFYNKHQLDWLRHDLAAASARGDVQHIVVLMHAPMFTASWGHKANSSWPTLSKEFSASGKVRLVLQGHNHVYERSHPIYVSATQPAGVRDDAKGTVYTTTGGGGSAFHGFNGPNPLFASQLTAHHYLRIDVNGPTLSVKAIAPNGAVLDSFTR